MTPTQEDTLEKELKEAFKRLETADKDCSLLINNVIEKNAARQNGRIEQLHEQLSKSRVAIAETGGQIVEIKAIMQGELKLVYEMINRLNEKIERIEANTSKEQNSKMMWRIALIAALPGVVSIVIKILEIFLAG